MNTAYWLAIIWGALAFWALLGGTRGKNAALEEALFAASAVSALLGVVIQYDLLS